MGVVVVFVVVGAHSKLGYFCSSFDRLLGGNFHNDLATPRGQSLQQWPGLVAANQVDRLLYPR